MHQHKHEDCRERQCSSNWLSVMQQQEQARERERESPRTGKNKRQDKIGTGCQVRRCWIGRWLVVPVKAETAPSTWSWMDRKPVLFCRWPHSLPSRVFVAFVEFLTVNRHPGKFCRVRWCGATVRRDDQTNPGSKPIKTTTDLFGNILCLELNQLSSQYLKTNIHQSLSPTLGRLPDLHRPSASDFVFFLRPRTQPRSGGFGRLVSGLHRSWK